MGGHSTLFAFVGYLFAAFFLAVSYYLRSKIRRFMDSASVAKGTVVSLEPAPLSLGSDLTDRPVQPVFTFRDAQGVEHRVRSTVGTYPASHKVGEAVDVFYHPQSPQEAVIDPKDFTQMARIFFFAGVLAIVIVTLIVVVGS